MKRTLLTLSLAIATIFASAQCITDPQFTDAGIYPDSATGLANAYVGQLYNQNITIITPIDTFVANPLGGADILVTIDNIDLTNVTGLPNSFSYTCDPPNCSFPGGTIECAELYSAGPTLAEIGLHQIIFETTTYVSNVPFINTTTQDDVIDYYYLNISAAASTLNQLVNTTFELKGVFPNPAVNNANIQFISGTSEAVTFKVYNLLGEEIESQFINSQRGVNTINVNTTSYSEGMYLYSINNGKEVLTKRMIVKN
jgi:hypothetical protein